MTARHSSKVSSGTARIKHRTRKEQSRCNTDGQVMFVYFPVVTRYGTPPKVLKISVFTYQSSSLGFETGPGSFRLIHICFTSAAGPQILNKQCCLIAFTFLRTFTSHPLPLPLLNSFDQHRLPIEHLTSFVRLPRFTFGNHSFCAFCCASFQVTFTNTCCSSEYNRSSLPPACATQITSSWSVNPSSARYSSAHYPSTQPVLQTHHSRRRFH